MPVAGGSTDRDLSFLVKHMQCTHICAPRNTPPLVLDNGQWVPVRDPTVIIQAGADCLASGLSLLFLFLVSWP